MARTLCVCVPVHVLKEGLHLAWSIDPCQVGEVRVHRHPDHLTVDVVELVGLVTERDDLRWTHKGAAKEKIF